MHPPTKSELLTLSQAEREERINFARRLGNHRAHAGFLKRALRRTYRAKVLGKGAPDPEASSTDIPPPAWRGMPTTGVRKTFALLIEFQDHRHRNSAGAINQTLYGRHQSGAPYDSVAAYYDRASYHQLDLYGGTTLGWYLTRYPRTLIEQSDAGRDRLIKEALEHFHSQGHDFSQYDTDGDGFVDFFQVLWAGRDAGWGSFWWPYQASFGDQSFSLDNVKFGTYAWMWDSRRGAPFDAETAIHETGHALGLPDYYDYDKSKGPAGGLGGLDMMDSAKYDHNCFSKWVLDWVKPRMVTKGSQVITLGPSGSLGDCVFIWPRVSRPAWFGEYFMAQNRERVGNDLALPGEGLVIWHVDARLKKKWDYACDNSFTEHKLLRLMEADGAEQIEAGKPADSGDYYRVGTSFGPATVPSSATYGRRRSGVEVTDISAQGSGLCATFSVARRDP